MNKNVKLPSVFQEDLLFAVKNKLWEIPSTGPMGKGETIDWMFIVPTKAVLEKYKGREEYIRVLVANDVVGSKITKKEISDWTPYPEFDGERIEKLNVRYTFGSCELISYKDYKFLFPDVHNVSMQGGITGKYI